VVRRDGECWTDARAWARAFARAATGPRTGADAGLPSVHANAVRGRGMRDECAVSLRRRRGEGWLHRQSKGVALQRGVYWVLRRVPLPRREPSRAALV
jgi:hypothetical protein